MKHVVIVGGGVSGLAAAYFLRKLSAEAGVSVSCTLIEAAPDLGGKIVTHRRDGFVIDGGPDSFLAQKPWAAELCRELGVADRLIGVNPAHRGVSVYHDGRLFSLPDGMLLGVPTKLWPFARSPLISWLGKLRMALDLVVPARQSDADESVGSFIRRRFGREAVEKLAEPLMAGIHAADPDRLSLNATFPQFAELERHHGSLIRGARAMAQARAHTATKPGSAFLTFPTGMREMVEALEANLSSSIKLIKRRRVVFIARDDAAASDASEPIYEIRTDDGGRLTADAIILATPAHVSSHLVDTLDPILSAGLARIHHVSTATVSLGFRRSDLGDGLVGTGFVVPRGEKCAITAGTWSSNKFNGRAPADHVLVRAFLGGARDESAAESDDEALIHLARAEVRNVLGVTAPPVVAEVFRWWKAIPQYDVGHLDRVAALDARCGHGLFLTGNAYHGVGIPDCVHLAKQVSEKVVRFLVGPEADARAILDSVEEAVSIGNT